MVPRQPEVDLDQGNWVGAPSVIDEGGYLRLWYRIRTNEARGAGYGLAESHDGIDWEKSSANPLFVPDHESNEGISVLCPEDTYRAWYTIDDGDTWHVAHAESDDGKDWTGHEIVIEGYCKDPAVVHVNGTYFMYAIGPTNTDISVHTSDDGLSWTRERTIELDVHSHPAAYYVEETGQFWLYAFAEEDLDSGDRFAHEELMNESPSRVSRAFSDDGTAFSEFETTWTDPPIGLDDRPAGGIDYGRFPTNDHGHLCHDDRVLVYYQARHNYHNNRPSWRWAGDGVIVLAGRFNGWFDNVPTVVAANGDLTYRAFPINERRLPDLGVDCDAPCTVTATTDTDDAAVKYRGWVMADSPANVTFRLSDSVSQAVYRLVVNGTTTDETTVDGNDIVTVSFQPDTNERTLFKISTDAGLGDV